MAAKLTPTGAPGTTGGSNPSESPSKLSRVTAGAGAALSSIASWGPVEKARKSSSLGYVAFPFTSTFSFVGKNWTRFSEMVWGPRKALSDTIAVTVPGWFGGKTSEEPIERALRHKWATYHQVEAKGYTKDQIKAAGWLMIDIPGGFLKSGYQTTVKKAIEGKLITPKDAVAAGQITEEQAKIQGWVMVTVDVPGKVWGVTPTEMLLREAIEKEYITVEEAVTAGHFTQEHAEAATWIQK